MPQGLPIIVGDDGKRYYDVPGSTRKFLVDEVDGTKPQDMNEPGIPNLSNYKSMTPEQQHVGFEQSKAHSKYMYEHNDQPSEDSLMSIGRFQVKPEDAIGMGMTMGPNLAKRASAGVSSLAETGNPLKAAGAMLKSQSGGIITRLMQLLKGEGGAAAEGASDIIPSQINPTGQTGTSFNLPNKSPLPVQPRWMVRPPKNMSMDRTDDLAGTLERIVGGGVKVKPPMSLPTDINPPLPANMTQTRTDDLLGTLQRLLKGARVE